MVRVDIRQLSCHGTWIDGYIPSIEELKQLSHLYQDFDIDEQGLPRAYGFSQATDWSQEEYFGSIASAFRGSFHRHGLSPNVQPPQCCMWLIKIEKEPSDPRIKPIYEEYKADSRKENYYHLIAICDECPVEDPCLQRIIQNLRFEAKPGTAYVNRELFMGTVRNLLSQYVRATVAPWLELERHLDTITDCVIPAGLLMKKRME